MTDRTQVLEHRVTSLERAFEKSAVALTGINDSLRTLAALEARHMETRNDLVRIADSQKDHESRLRVIEAELPGLKMVRGWIVAGVLGVLGLVGTAVVKLVVLA